MQYAVCGALVNRVRSVDDSTRKRPLLPMRKVVERKGKLKDSKYILSFRYKAR